MIVLSCFDGMSCGQIAFQRAGIKIKKYYASEIDKYAIKVTQANFPDTIQLGDITKWKSWDIETPDIIIAGSPCQGFSFAGKQLNFEDERSKLFFVFVDILKHYKPKYFLLENVIIKAEYNDVISRLLGELYPESIEQSEMFQSPRLEPIEINSAMVSAQNRRRLYWTNIQGIEQPEDKGILLKDIIEDGVPQLLKNQGKEIVKENINKSHSLMARDYKGFGNQEMTGIKITADKIVGRNPDNPKSRIPGLPTKQMLEIKEDGKSNCFSTVSKDSLCIQIRKANLNGHDYVKRVYSPEGKSPNLCTGTGENHEPKISEDHITWRKLSPIECERLQTVPNNYTNHVSNSQRYKMLGNGWTIDVIAHIFKNIKL